MVRTLGSDANHLCCVDAPLKSRYIKGAQHKPGTVSYNYTVKQAKAPTKLHIVGGGHQSLGRGYYAVYVRGCGTA